MKLLENEKDMSMNKGNLSIRKILNSIRKKGKTFWGVQLM